MIIYLYAVILFSLSVSCMCFCFDCFNINYENLKWHTSFIIYNYPRIVATRLAHGSYALSL